MQTCTAKFSGNLCGSEAIARFGIRCRNGCFGEGAFEYICAEHVDYAEVSIEDVASYICNRCKQYAMEFFPVQMLVV